MQQNQKSVHTCSICGKKFPLQEMTAGALVRNTVVQVIQSEHPDWSIENYLCRKDLSHYRDKYVQQLLVSEKGELTSLEQEVMESIQAHQVLATNIDAEFEQKWSMGERLADRIASFGGSWWFLIAFGIFIISWIAINSMVFLNRPVDPYPFILLNLLLSCLAAIQAPIIMMSQNRHNAKDRLRSQHDYQVNLKAELEIRHLHEKIDHLLSRQWERLMKIQEIQFDMLAELQQKH
ncbi:MAG: hypothetical protein C0616_15405 [Desulfuromonas sp.]|nr:MAG: hypothetical protein C0616_15405 [Desulfuromonas sp.]